MNSDGSNLSPLFDTPFDPDERFPDWAPSGKKMIFTKESDAVFGGEI